MTADSWKRAIGEQAWNHIARTLPDGDEPIDSYIAKILTSAHEVGFRAPVVPPQVSPGGTRVMFPGSKGAAVTAGGLLAHWRAKGHGWAIFRVDELCRAIAGPLLPRFQELCAAYESQCEASGLSLEEMVPADWAGFVGGSNANTGNLLIGKALASDAPPVLEVLRAHVAGPG